MTDTFPRQYARTQRFTLGEPRNVTVSPDGRRVVFVRSTNGDDPVNCLWVLDACRRGEERLVADPRPARRPATETLSPAEERARPRTGPGERGRHRGLCHQSRGHGGRLRPRRAAVRRRAGDRAGPGARGRGAGVRPAPGPVGSPRWPTSADRRCAIGELDGIEPGPGRRGRPRHQLGLGRVRGRRGDGSQPRLLVGARRRRRRGLPGRRLGRCRRGGSPIRPIPSATRTPTDIRPRARPNAAVELHVVRARTAGRGCRSSGNASGYPYLADGSWSEAGLVLTVQSRDQRDLAVLRADPAAGATEAAARRARRRLGRARPGIPGAAPRRSAGAGGRPRGGPPAARRRRDRRRPPSSRCAASSCRCGRRHRVQRASRSTTRRRSRCGAGRRPAARRRRAAGRCTPRRSAGRRRSSARLAHRTRPVLAPSSSAVRPSAVRPRSRSSQPERALLRLGDAAWPPPCCCRTTAPSRSPAAGAARPVRRPARPAGAEHPGRRSSPRSGSPTRGSRSSSSTVGARRGEAATGSGPFISISPAGARGPGRRAATRPPRAPAARSVAGRHPGLELRRLPRRARRAASSRCVPRRGGRCAGDRVAALRHPLHGAISRRSDARPGGLRPVARCSPRRTGSSAR